MYIIRFYILMEDILIFCKKILKLQEVTVRYVN